MNLSTLSNSEIEAGLKKGARKENEGFAEVIAHLVEVEKRKLYLDKRMDLLEYLIQDHGYSQTAGLQRIKAMREVKDVPEIQEMIEDGSIHMSQLAELHRATKQKEAETKKKLSKEEKLNLVKKIQGQSHKQTQKILETELDLKIRTPGSKINQKDGSTHVKENYTEEDIEILKQCLDIASHSLAQNHQGFSHRDLVMHLANHYLKANTPTSVSQSANLTPNRRRNIIQSEKCCQYKINDTEICGKTIFLEVDHIHPQWNGGKHNSENLRVYCSQHNKWRYQTGH